jgi:hypothetical protein
VARLRVLLHRRAWQTGDGRAGVLPPCPGRDRQVWRRVVGPRFQASSERQCPERGRGCLKKRGLAISTKVVLPGRPWPRWPSAMRRRLHEGLGHALPRGRGGGRTVDPEGPRGSPGRRGSWQLFVWIARAPKQNPQRSSLLFGGGGWAVCKLRRCRLRASRPPSMIRNADHPEDMPVGRSPHVDGGLEGELWP